MTALTGFKSVTEERFMEMLEVLPPAVWIPKGFLVGEPYDHRPCKVSGTFAPTFSAFFEIGNEHFAADEAMTVKEFRALSVAEVAA